MTRNQTFSVDIGWQALLKDFGVQPSHVLRRAGLPEDLFSREGHGLTTEEYFRFWQSLEAEAGDVMFPLRIVETLSVESFDPPLFAALCSANLMQAVQRLAKYKQLLVPMSLEVEVGNGGELTILPRWLSVQMQVPFSLQVAEIAFYLRLARLATREPVKALRVALRNSLLALMRGATRTSSASPCNRGLRRASPFRPWICCARSSPSTQACGAFSSPTCAAGLLELDATATTAERVRAVLLELLPSNAATIEKAAQRLGMSKRTLQRRLEDEGENFRAMVNATRENLARHYLTNTKMSGGEIAFLLGFEDPNSFYRAFQDWTGQTPDVARNAMHLN